MDVSSSSGISMSMTSLASSTDTDERLSVSSHSTLDPPRPLVATVRRQRQKRPLPGQQPQTGGGGSPLGRPGKRWKRRQLNESYLHSLATVAEVTEEDITGCPWPESPLSDLFLHPDRMLAWQRFSELPDDQQLEFLARHSCSERDADAEEAEPVDEVSEDAELKAVVVGCGQPEPSPPGRAWGRLSATCRDFALRKALPGSRFHADLASLERELRDLFQDGCAPWADWVSGGKAPCDRLIVHCAAGYLGLQSASEDGPDGCHRCVCVRRWPGRQFRPPVVSLTSHLAGMRHRRERQLMRSFAVWSDC